jgi:hypothetical protein
MRLKGEHFLKTILEVEKMKKPFSVLFAVILLAGMLSVSASAASISPTISQVIPMASEITGLDLNPLLPQLAVTGPGFGDFYVSKHLTTDLSMLWYATVDNNFLNDTPNAVRLDDLGQVLLTGKSDLGVNNSDAFSVKLGPFGGIMWQKVYNAGTIEFGKDIISDPQGTVYLQAIVDGKMHLQAFEPSPSGIPLWNTIYTATSYLYGGKIYLDSGYIINVMKTGGNTTFSKIYPSGQLSISGTAYQILAEDSELIPNDGFYLVGRYSNNTVGVIAKNHYLHFGQIYQISFPGFWGNAIAADPVTKMAVAVGGDQIIALTPQGAVAWQKQISGHNYKDVCMVGNQIAVVGSSGQDCLLEIYDLNGTLKYDYIGLAGQFNVAKANFNELFCAGAYGPTGIISKFVIGAPPTTTTIPPTTTTITPTTTTTTTTTIPPTTTTTLPPTPATLTQALIWKVQSYNVHSGIENSLDAKLAHALEALEAAKKNSFIVAINALQAFINEVQAQSGKLLTVEQAQELVIDANYIIDLMQ